MSNLICPINPTLSLDVTCHVNLCKVLGLINTLWWGIIKAFLVLFIIFTALWFGDFFLLGKFSTFFLFKICRHRYASKFSLLKSRLCYAKVMHNFKSKYHVTRTLHVPQIWYLAIIGVELNYKLEAGRKSAQSADRVLSLNQMHYDWTKLCLLL